MGDRATLVQKLLDHYPYKAFELLMDYLQNKDKRTETEQYIGQNDPCPARLDPTIEQQTRSSRSHAHHSESPRLQRTIRQSLPDARHTLHTPPASTASVKSPGSSLAAAGVEKIYLVSSDDAGREQPVLSRSAPVKHNLISDKVVCRGLGASLEDVNDVVTVLLLSGARKSIKVNRAVNLTWRRDNIFKTNEATFFIVPDRYLDCDVMMGPEESEDLCFPTDYEDPISSRIQQRGLVLEEIDEPIPPHAPTAPMPSLRQSHVQRTYESIQALRDNQQTRGAAEPPGLRNASLTPRLKSPEHVQPNHTAAAHTDQESGAGQLHLMGMWDKTPLKMTFDPGAAGEAFYQAFYQWAVRRKRDGDLDRERTTLLLKANRDVPDEEAWELGLNQGELEELWEATVEWMQENKGPRAPHLYAKVTLEAG